MNSVFGVIQIMLGGGVNKVSQGPFLLLKSSYFNNFVSDN